MDGLAKENPDDWSCTAVYGGFNSVFKGSLLWALAIIVPFFRKVTFYYPSY